VLGFPGLLEDPPKAPTEMELATSLHPTAVIEWLGNNDALVPALIGQLQALTPLDQFQKNYKQILDDLQGTGAKIVTATIPDVTETPYFTSPRTLAQQWGKSVGDVTMELGIGPHDFIRPSAQIYVDGIFSGALKGPLPVDCPAPLSNLGVGSVPCVLTAEEASLVRSTINCFNAVIEKESAAHGAAVVDVHLRVEQIFTAGYKLKNVTLTSDFFGGLFSLDGIHPTATGYGIIANEFIKTINKTWNTSISEANIDEIFATDPLKQYARPLPATSNQRGIVSNTCAVSGI
jgi:lysophospholipase L1-like esterase